MLPRHHPDHIQIAFDLVPTRRCVFIGRSCSAQIMFHQASPADGDPELRQPNSNVAPK